MGFFNKVENLFIHKTDETSANGNYGKTSYGSGVGNSIFDTYIVQSGDSLSKIAREHSGVTTKMLIEANPQIKNPDLIYAGDKINIPTKNKEKAANNDIYTVKKGDTLWKIARKYPNMTAQMLIDANPQIKNPDLIYPGDKINIPTVKQSENVEFDFWKDKKVPEKKEIKYNTVMTNSGRIVKEANIDDVYNKELSSKITSIAVKETEGRTSSIGYCAKYVRKSLEKAGLLKWGSTLGKDAYEYEKVLDNHPNFQRVSVTRSEIKNLPEGCIVVWQNGSKTSSSDAFKKYGHIFITTGDGKEASDHVKDILMHDDVAFAVYVPVKSF